jgi:hypothetical protein
MAVGMASSRNGIQYGMLYMSDERHRMCIGQRSNGDVEAFDVTSKPRRWGVPWSCMR